MVCLGLVIGQEVKLSVQLAQAVFLPALGPPMDRDGWAYLPC